MSKILLISHIFPPAVDGGSKVIYKLGQYFESQHHQTLYLSSDCSSTDDFVKSKYQKTKQLTNQIKLPVYHYLRRPLKFLNLFFNQDLLRVLQKGPIFNFFPFLKATIQILKFKPDFIVAGPLPTTIILYARFFQKITKTKLVINASFHQTDPDFHQKPLIKSLQSADFLWTLSQYETDYFIKNFNINPDKIILAGNGVDENFLKKSKNPHLIKEGVKGRFNILFIGSLAAHKRVDLLIKSFANIPEVNLTIAGQKTLFYPQIQKIVNSLKSDVKSRINFIFNFSNSQLANLIDSCDVLVLPSIQESFGLVLIEAWARSKPVLVSNIPVLSEMIQKTNGGLTFKKDNLIDLQKQLEKIITLSNLRLQLGQNGFNYVKNNYTWEQVGQKIWQKISL
jgi:glycosyltransferase involved in cell wall biosynthesis